MIEEWILLAIRSIKINYFEMLYIPPYVNILHLFSVVSFAIKIIFSSNNLISCSEKFIKNIRADLSNYLRYYDKI